MAEAHMSYEDLGRALGESWRSSNTLAAAEVIMRIAKNTKSQQVADTLIKQYLKKKRRELEVLRNVTTTIPASES